MQTQSASLIYSDGVKAFLFFLVLPNLFALLSVPSSNPLIAGGILAIIAVVLYTHLCVYVSDYEFMTLPVFSPAGG